MAQTKKRPAPPCQAATGLPLTKMQLASYDQQNSFSLPAAQAAFLARLGLDAPRARLTAELAWGRP